MKIKNLETLFHTLVLIFLILLYTILFLKTYKNSKNNNAEKNEVQTILNDREDELKRHDEKTKTLIKNIDQFLFDNPAIKNI